MKTEPLNEGWIIPVLKGVGKAIPFLAPFIAGAAGKVVDAASGTAVNRLRNDLVFSSPSGEGLGKDSAKNQAIRTSGLGDDESIAKFVRRAAKSTTTGALNYRDMRRDTELKRDLERAADKNEIRAAHDAALDRASKRRNRSIFK
jgi:hypothetical protein